TEAVENLSEILSASDVVMVARGDLGVEIGDAELPVVQKHIIREARSHNRVVITATQMMESMITSPIPTRAEVMDVANAVIDGTDAVMLSGETAVGKYPVETVSSMARVCNGAERHLNTVRSKHRLNEHFTRTDEAIAMAAMYTANHLHVKVIVSLTETGSTALWLSRISSGIPILALTRHDKTRRKVKMYRGVYPVSFDVLRKTSNHVLEDALVFLKKKGMVEAGDLVVMTRGDLSGITGGTNTMKILKVSATPAL
ncbi:MAG: pyruvate kinase, partial [Gammaproteobacteria bacterium]|nr:pyruvate kinase [Gammaproteobacteria bacterium]